MAKHRKKPAPLPHDISRLNVAHPLARGLFGLRIDAKALAATLDEDDAIAHPSGVQINNTGFHIDALGEVRKLAISLTRACFRQVIECLFIAHQAGSPEIVAVRIYLERVAEQLKSRHFTNDSRMIASDQSSAARDLCTLALENFALHSMRKIKV